MMTFFWGLDFLQGRLLPPTMAETVMLFQEKVILSSGSVTEAERSKSSPTSFLELLGLS